MLPHKTSRGQIALGKLATYEGIPEPYDKMKRVVVPDALKAVRMRSDRNFCVLGVLSKEVGWGYTELVGQLEAQRKIKDEQYYNEKKAKVAARAKAIKSYVVSASDKKILADAGY